MANVYHFLGFNMHQPMGNMLALWDMDWNHHQAREIILAYERPLKYAEQYPHEARFHVCFSGILLEQFQDEEVVKRYRDIVDIPRMLERYRNAGNIEIAGTGYYHPVFPLIPEADWDEQIARGRNKVREIFGREPEIFWPPEMGFSCNMIPHLVHHGYKYVICDGVHVIRDGVKAISGDVYGDPMEQNFSPEVLYRTHFAEHGGKTIIVVPRDTHLSRSQQRLVDPDYFHREVGRKTDGIDIPALVTTWTDGENGGWFRQMLEPEQFWGKFFAPYMDRVKAGRMPCRPMWLRDFVRENPPVSKVHIEAGTWPDYDKWTGVYFRQWSGSENKRRAADEIRRVSDRYQDIAGRLEAVPESSVQRKLQSALDHILQAEASDNLYHEDWLSKLHEETALAHRDLNDVTAIYSVAGLGGGTSG